MSDLTHSDIADLLSVKHDQYNTRDFILTDPIQVPHSFSDKEDIELAAFYTAMLAWGNRASIIRSANRLMDRLGREPALFMKTGEPVGPDQFEGFVHRTLNAGDLFFFTRSLQNIYQNHGGLEAVFLEGYRQDGVFGALRHFRNIFCFNGFPARTARHIPDVMRGSAAKRLNLFLMWMVRNDNRGVHFGLWKSIPASELMIPLDTHVGRVARSLGLLTRKSNDWQAVMELTDRLREFDPDDPCRFDFSLFGLGLFDRF